MTRYYVAVGSERTGPFSPDELRAAAIAIEPGTLVWTQGMSEWSRADCVAELTPLLAEAKARGSASSPAEPPPVPMAAMAAQGAVGTDFILLNPRLPRMAQAICVFGLVVGPALWLINTVSCLASYGDYDTSTPLGWLMSACEVVFAIGSLITMVVIALGAWQFRDLRRVGLTVLKIGFWADIVLFGLAIMVLIAMAFSLAAVAPYADALAASAATADAAPPRTSTTHPGGVVNGIMMVLSLLALAWEIVSLVWLTRRADRLPLT
jgi:hypothetical protein